MINLLYDVEAGVCPIEEVTNMIELGIQRLYQELKAMVRSDRPAIFRAVTIAFRCSAWGGISVRCTYSPPPTPRSSTRTQRPCARKGALRQPRCRGARK